jgi:3-oxoacyl-[acyl-carrier-protein] synthase II
MKAVITGAAVCVPGLDGAGRWPAGVAVIDPGLERSSNYRDRASDLAVRAVGPALSAAGLLGQAGPGLSIATIVSTSYGALEQACLALDTIRRSSARALSPRMVHAMSSHVIGTWVSIEYGFRGPCLTLCDGPVSGLDAVHWARNMLAVARADVVVVIGVEPRTAPVLRLLGEDLPILDGAAAVVLEAEGHALARGVRPRASFGAYLRAAHLEAALQQLGPLSLDWWIPPEPGEPGGASLPAALARVPRIDLARGLGRSSSALGVIQVALASALAEQGAPAAALAVCGGRQDIAAAVVSSVTAQAASCAPSASGTETS